MSSHGIEFVNVRTGERRTVSREPQLAALINSSDRGPNAHGGQDFGWRLGEAVVVTLEKILKDEREMDRVATRYQIPLDRVDESTVLRYILDKSRAKADDDEDADGTDYEAEYQENLRKLRESKKAPAKPAAKKAEDKKPEQKPAEKKAEKPETGSEDRNKSDDSKKAEESKSQ